MTKRELEEVIGCVEGAVFDTYGWVLEYADTRRDFDDASEKNQVTRMNKNAETLNEIEQRILAEVRAGIVENMKVTE